MGDRRKCGSHRWHLDSHAQLAMLAPFVWTKTADQILAKIARFAHATLEHHGADEN